MSVSLHVTAFRPADECWQKMKTIYETCEKANVPIPKEVQEFFGWDPPGDKPGMEVKMGESMAEWYDQYRQGYEIDITKLPKNIRYIRAYLS